MAIYVYPPVSLSIISGPTAFIRNGSNQNVIEDTIAPSNSRALPTKLLNTSGVSIDPATEAKQDLANTKLDSINTSVDAVKTSVDAVKTSTDAGNNSLANIDDQTLSIQNEIGNTTDAPAASDTATASLNSMLKRIAQRITSLISLFPTSLGSKADASSLAVTLATEDKAIVGPLTEIAPATDTGSSGLNGRLQRIAQRLSSLISLLPASLGSKVDASSLAVTWATEDKAALGSVAETAPVSDTASSGLNGRMQRIAQRLTSLIALFPTALGQSTMANSFRVVVASDQSTLPVNQAATTPTYNQDLTVNSTTIVTIAAPAGAKGAKVWADKDNAQALRVTMDGSTSPTSTVGFRFEGGRSEDFIGVGSLKVLSEGSSITGQGIYVQWRV